ncbi:MAG TPA: 5-(carboxyamino)imidazole ribonucleotide synthase [Gemmatimonadales bacterium]|jgi:5-(carboxyamino)imidazole ribonucleotide synthase|nr:5-(carboxyamino)imidazole ribonucleotide synthase [Gemmatimonadales bacterium]
MILPGAAIGLLGGGQLGRMFTMAARTMGYRVLVLDPDPESPAGGVADRHIHAAYEDPKALEVLAQSCAVVTTEFENVPAAALARLEKSLLVRPRPGAVAVAQNRIDEKSFVRDHGLHTAKFYPIRRSQDLEPAFAEIGAPALLKTSRLGYDGKGQATVDSLPELVAAFQVFKSVECILEERLTLEREISVVLARGVDGATAAFPAGENVHAQGILDTTTVPARVSPALAKEAHSVATALAKALDYVGVLGIEFFVAAGGRLLINEIAPRPHNSGHYTLDGCITSQFEQQVRAVTGLPLGAVDLKSPIAMANLLGDLWQGGEPHWAAALQNPRIKLHLYGKKEPRPGRKMGHLNALAESPEAALRAAVEARARLQR